MQDIANHKHSKASEIELPQSIINEFARFIVPEIRKYYDSEQGQREFAEWQAKQQMNTGE
ncbi:MAG: hypothetical protein FWH51_01730 [Dehalococcoidia bacterium]|nr:hypothetical protein [Dehalococcoidia bacterium]